MVTRNNGKESTMAKDRRNVYVVNSEAIINGLTMLAATAIGMQASGWPAEHVALGQDVALQALRSMNGLVSLFRLQAENNDELETALMFDELLRTLQHQVDNVERAMKEGNSDV